MPVETSVVQRAVLGMTLGVVAAHEMRKQADWEGGLDEYDQQFIVPVSATVAEKTLWAEVSVGFAVEFFNPPERDSPYSVPLFTYGFQFGTGKPVMLTAIATRITARGATINIGAVNPGVRKPVKFSGSVHLNFQGYAAPINDDMPEEG